MVFNRATIDDWKTKPSQARLLDVFVGQDQIEIRKGKMVRTRYRNKGTPLGKASESTSELTWTPAEDALIIGMKAHGKSFAKMSKSMKGKSEDAIIDRYRELFDRVLKKNVENKEKPEAAEEEEKKEELVKENTKENKKGATNEALKDIKETEKDKEADAKLDNSLQKLNGKPVIYVDDGGKDKLSTTEVGMLYVMNAHFEDRKWTAMAAKFFDKTGKRVKPDALKEQLKNA